MFEKKQKKPKRFIIKEDYTLGLGAIQILTDTVTGVTYINTIGTSMSGITPLLDENGNVVITPVSQEDTE